MRFAVALSVIALSAEILLAAACSGAPAAAPAGPAATAPTAPASAATTPAAGFTVAGSRPVPGNGSQDTSGQDTSGQNTSGQAAAAGCDPGKFAADKRLGAAIASGFAVGGLPASADLLRHFLAGSGTAAGYPAGSRISRLAAASAAFQSVSASVRAVAARQLRAGVTRVRLPASQLPLVSFDSAAGDLYWGFRGTQGLTVTGRGRPQNGVFSGTLTFVIRDSYGFPAGDTLGGFGAPMRYLQTACGAPQHPGGARWFPDTITVSVPFRAARLRPARYGRPRT